MTPSSPSEIFPEYPPGIRMVLLMHYENPSGDYVHDVLPYSKAASKIEDKIVERNMKGQQLEKELRIDEAIKLYEKNIAEFADTPYPYERLRIIFTKRKQYDDAIRVCQAYIEMSRQLSNAVMKELGDVDLAKQLAQTSDMPTQIEKLTRLQNRNEEGFIEPIISPPKALSIENESVKPAKRSFNWKLIGIIFAVLFFGFCACVAFGMILQMLGY